MKYENWISAEKSAPLLATATPASIAYFCAGAVQRTTMADTNVAFTTAAAKRQLNSVESTNPAPWMAIIVPPAIEPELGQTLERVTSC